MTSDIYAPIAQLILLASCHLHHNSALQNKFLYETTQKRGSGLAIPTSGVNCDWLKAVIY